MLGFFSFLTFNYEKTSYSILMSILVYSRCRPNTTGTWAYPMDIRPKWNVNEAFIGRSGYYMNALYLLHLRCGPIGKHHNNGSYLFILFVAESFILEWDFINGMSRLNHSLVFRYFQDHKHFRQASETNIFINELLTKFITVTILLL